MARRKRKKREFSKVLLFWIAAFTFAVTVFGCILAWITRDTSLFAYLIPACFGELATATGFYYYKAKAENEIKLQKLYEKESANDRPDTHL